MRFVNSPIGRELRLRGMNTRVVGPGRVRVGELVRVLPSRLTACRPSSGRGRRLTGHATPRVPGPGQHRQRQGQVLGRLRRDVARRGHAAGAVAVVQFVKSGQWKTGEQKLAGHLGVEWHALGDGFTWDSDRHGRDRGRGAPCLERWPRACSRRATTTSLILDEITYIMTFGWVPVDEVVAAIAGRSPATNVVCTGRDARPQLIELADTVTEMVRRQARVRPGDRCPEGHRVLTPEPATASS